MAWPPVELTPDGEHEEPSLEYEAKRGRSEVDLKVEAAMKRVREPQHGGELAELDEIGMASGQPPGEEGKAQRRDSATKATEVESGQPQVQPVDQTAGTTRSAEYLNFLAEAEMKAVDPDQWLMDDSDADDVENIPDRVAAVLTGPHPKRKRPEPADVPRRHHALDEAGDRSPCERGKISQWVLPRCSGRPRPAWAGRSTGGHIWGLPVPSVCHRGQPNISELPAPALKRHKRSGLESISGMGKPFSKHRPR